MSLALYRTYRPVALSEVVGQDHITVPLARALENDRVHHAYLFSGPRGCGKTSTARIMARSLNCQEGPTPQPCGQCVSCVDLSAGGPGSIDVIELDAASHGHVEDARDLRERAMFAPAYSRFKIYIIDEAHMISREGFNALLKVVEEPPEHVRFIFATTDPEKVLPTIRSRTFNYAFRLVPTRELQDHLKHVCEREGVPSDSSALGLIARAGGGSVRDSLSILGQIIAGSSDEGITHPLVVEQLGVTDTSVIDEVMVAVANQDGRAIFDVIDRVVSAGHDPRRFAIDVLDRFRDVIVAQNVPDALERRIIDVPEEDGRRILDQARQLGPAQAGRAADIVSEALSGFKGATAPRLHLELMAARLLVPSAGSGDADIVSRVEQLERKTREGIDATPAAGPPVARQRKREEPAVSGSTDTESPAVVIASSEKPVHEGQTEGAGKGNKPNKREAAAAESAAKPVDEDKSVVAGGDSPTTNRVTIDSFVTMWPAILDSLKGYSRVAWMVFDGSHPVSWSDGVLAVGLNDSGKVASLATSGHDERLRAAIADVLKMDVQIDVVVAPSGGSNRDAGGQAHRVVSVEEVDEARPDDENSDDVVGVPLIMRELGATQIGEIEH